MKKKKTAVKAKKLDRREFPTLASVDMSCVRGGAGAIDPCIGRTKP